MEVITTMKAGGEIQTLSDQIKTLFSQAMNLDSFANVTFTINGEPVQSVQLVKDDVGDFAINLTTGE